MAAVQPELAPTRRGWHGTVLVVLVLVAVAGWAVFLAQAANPAMDMAPGDLGAVGTDATSHGSMDRGAGTDAAMGPGAGHRGRPPDLTMGAAAPAFLASWIAMMAAMMLPAAAPMILLYARTQPDRPLPVALFTGSYLALWALFGVVAFLLAIGIEDAVGRWPTASRHWARAAGVFIVGAGLYQLTPFKQRCLRRCRSPLSFIVTSWRPGLSGAVRMGLDHGLTCAGCCWLLFLVLVPIGVMDVAAMVLVAAAVFSEKVLPRPELTRLVVAGALVAYGVAVVARPELLPTVA